MAEVPSDVWFVTVALIFIPFTATSVRWTAPPPAWTQTDPTDIRTVDMQVLLGSTQVPLRWNYALSAGTVLVLTTFIIDDGASDDIGFTGGVTTINDRNDYQTRFAISTSEVATLIINNVTEREEATFQCKLTVQGNTWAYNIRVTVTVAAKLTIVSGDQTVREGSNMQLFCEATGKPTPTITWTRVLGDDSNSEVLQQGLTLNFANINRTASGTYRCTAYNGAGNPVSQGVKVNVTYSPSITSDGHTIDVPEGSAASIPCPVDGNPRPNITWYKGNDTSSKIINKSTLEFPDTTLSDSGWYTCFAENSLGKVTARVHLLVAKPSTKPTTGAKPPTKPTTGATEECSCNDVMLAAIIGVLVLIIIVLIIYIVWLRKKGTTREQRPYREEVVGVYDYEVALRDLEPSKSTQPRSEYMDLNEATVDKSTTQSAAQGADYANLHPLTRSWEVSRQHVTIEKIIGKGAFGQVAKGTAEIRSRPGKTTVAIKMLKLNSTESDKRDLLKELETMKLLKPHPHVIKLLGCVTESEPLLVLIEYVPFGDLLGYLRKSRGLNDTYFKDPDIKPQSSLTSQQLMKFAWQIADGMSYLSSKSIIHRDLAARNVLVGEREVCKVTDFGMARDVQLENIYERKTKGRLPVKWTAHEALLYGTYTTKSDIWSFGVVLYEIFTIGGSPYPRMDGKKIANLLQQGYRMPKPSHVDDELYQIMMNCWQNDPDARPTFTDLKNQLKDMENQHKRLINMEMYDKQLYANVEDLVV